METKRHKGYVVGSDTVLHGRTVWRVRVKDPTSPHNGQKLVVASTHEGITLARGLNVTFLVGSVDDERGEKAVRAVDVSLESLKGDSTTHSVNRSGGQS